MSGPDPRHEWFLVSELDVDGVPVIFWMPQGEVVGMKKWIRKGKAVSYRVRDKTGRDYVDLPRFAWPSLWRPLRQDLWPYPLPEPAVIQPDPEPVRPKASPRVDPPKLDVSINYYSPPGEISRREAEVRMIRFIRTEGVSPNDAPTALRVGWPSVADSLTTMIAAWDEGRSYPIDDPVPVWVPTPKDVSDSHIVHKWFISLNPPALGGERINSLQRALILRARLPTPTWADMALRLKTRDPEGLYERAVNAVHRAANGLEVFPGLKLPDPMEELRARNRAWRESGEWGER